MKKFLLCFWILPFANAFAQQDTSIKLDLLKAPASPGFILLNKQPTDIERPTSVTDFAISFRNATSNYESLPKNYAVEFAPAWLFNGKNIGFEAAYGEDSHKDTWRNIWHSLNLSMAYAVVDSSKVGASQFGFGFKTSIVRGKISKEFSTQVNLLQANLAKQALNFDNLADSALKKDKDYRMIDSMFMALIKKPNPTEADNILRNSLQTARRKLGDLIKDKVAKDYKSKLEDERKAIISKLSKTGVTRTGWFLDLAGGAVLDFPTQAFDYSRIHKFGAWLTGGYEWEGISVLGLSRVLQNGPLPFDVVTYTTGAMPATETATLYASTTNMDGGLRVLYKDNKFSASLEGLFRSYIKGYKFSDSWKGTVYLGYEFMPNKLLTLNISRDFAGTVTKKGNLVTALNLIIGLGSARGVAN